MAELLATKRNMEARWDPDVVAYSPETGETCSAHPADYFWLMPDNYLEDACGNPMFLGRRRSAQVELLTA